MSAIFQIEGTIAGNPDLNLYQFVEASGMPWQNLDGQFAQLTFHDVALPVPEPARAALALAALETIASRHRRRR